MTFSAGAGFAAGAAFSLVLAGGTAYAATGGTFLLGKANSASTQTTLTNSAGTPLSLGAKPGFPPLKVNSLTKVSNLNVDKLDGLSGEQFLRSTGKATNADKLDSLDSTAFARVTGGTGTRSGSGTFFDTDGDMVNDAIVAIADCPVGTIVTGGGYFNETGQPIYFQTSTEDGASWGVVVKADNTADPLKLSAIAQCYNPRGPIAPEGQALKRQGSFDLERFRQR